MGRPCPGCGPRSQSPIHLGQRTGPDTSSAHRSPWHRARRNSSQDSAARGPVTLTLNAFASAGILPTEVFNHRFWAAHWTDWRRTDCAQFYLLPLSDVPALAAERRQIVRSGHRAQSGTNWSRLKAKCIDTPTQDPLLRKSLHEQMQVRVNEALVRRTRCDSYQTQGAVTLS